MANDFQIRVLCFEVLELATLGEDAFGVDDDSLDVGLKDSALSGFEQLRIDVHGVGLCLHERVGYTLLAKGIVGGDDRDGLRCTGMGGGDPADTVVMIWWLALERAGQRLPTAQHSAQLQIIDGKVGMGTVPSSSEEVKLLIRTKAEGSQTRTKFENKLLVLLVGEELEL